MHAVLLQARDGDVGADRRLCRLRPCLAGIRRQTGESAPASWRSRSLRNACALCLTDLSLQGRAPLHLRRRLGLRLLRLFGIPRAPATLGCGPPLRHPPNLRFMLSKGTGDFGGGLGKLRTAGVIAVVIAAWALPPVSEPALAKKAPPLRTQPPIGWYRSSDNVRIDCVERSFSISAGNPAYPNRLAMWPAPCQP